MVVAARKIVTARKPLSPKLRESLGLADRRVPEFYEDAESVIGVPHATAIRTALDKFELSAVYCVQGLPTVGILAVDQYDRDAVVELRAKLWNQGLASLLLVIDQGKVRAFSLVKRPLAEDRDSFEQQCLIDTLHMVNDALRIRGLIASAESGRLWGEYGEHFPSEERVDRVLLDNLTVSHKLLLEQGLPSDAAQTLLIQTMFIAYLEDREIINPEIFKSVSKGCSSRFSELLAEGDVGLFRDLFERLLRDFNGDLFLVPGMFEPQSQPSELNSDHLSIIARFRSGKEEMRGGQLRFLGYNFAVIPIELVSAVHDRFLGGRVIEPILKGAHYTPMFLADLSVAQLWDMMPDRIKNRGRFLDPACGSGVFLVLAFQRLCEHWRSVNCERDIPWNTLQKLLDRMNGWDKDNGAIRVAVFSLYVALLEEATKEQIVKHFHNRKLLPLLREKNLVCRNFFSRAPANSEFDIILGNPPWAGETNVGGSSTNRNSTKPASSRNFESAWAFSWNALDYLREGGMVGYLLPANGFLHGCSRSAIRARNAFFDRCRVLRIIDLTDFRRQIFEEAKRPTALMIFGGGKISTAPRHFDYWAPKASPDLRKRRVFVLAPSDKLSLSVSAAHDNPSLFKQRMWLRGADAKLFSYLEQFPKVGDLFNFDSETVDDREDAADGWAIGLGYTPAMTGISPLPVEAAASRHEGHEFSKFVARLPNLTAQEFTRLVQGESSLQPAESALVKRRGFEQGFTGVRILMPKGLIDSGTRLRAAYRIQPLTFPNSIRAISVPKGEERRAKLLTALLNSRILAWYAFHESTTFGLDRHGINQGELLRLPFPAPSDFLDPKAASGNADKLVGIIDNSLKNGDDSFGEGGIKNEILRRIDEHAYAYFGLTDDDIAIIDDTIEYVMPGMQPSERKDSELWREPVFDERASYAATLARRLKGWMRGSIGIGTRLMARSPDLSILRLKLADDRNYAEEDSGNLADALGRLRPHINLPINENFQTAPDLRVYFEGCLYLIKPMQMRFWMRSVALTDADEIAQELRNLAAPQGLRSAS